jgi:outer membrane lipoprotein-sorting protein
MTRYFHVVALGCLALVVASGCKRPPEPSKDTTTALDVLKKADAAHKALTSVKYAIGFDATSPAGAGPPKVTADVLLKGWGSFGLPKRFRADAVIMFAAPVKLTIGCDGEQFYVVDHGRKKVHVGADPKVLGTARDILRAVTVAELVHPEPYGDELSNTASQDLKASEKIAGEDCYQVEVKYPGGQRSSVWWFSKTSFLVRAVHRSHAAAGGSEVARQTLSSLDPSALPDSAFAMVVPEGYVTTQDIAN